MELEAALAHQRKKCAQLQSQLDRVCNAFLTVTSIFFPGCAFFPLTSSWCRDSCRQKSEQQRLRDHYMRHLPLVRSCTGGRTAFPCHRVVLDAACVLPPCMHVSLAPLHLLTHHLLLCCLVLSVMNFFSSRIETLAAENATLRAQIRHMDDERRVGALLKLFLLFLVSEQRV